MKMIWGHFVLNVRRIIKRIYATVEKVIKCMKKEDKIDNNKTKKSFIKMFEKSIPITVGVLSVLAVVYSVMNILYNLTYQLKCEKFYGIPGKYFHSSIDKNLIYLALVSIFIGFCAAIISVRKNNLKKQCKEKRSRVEIVFLCILVGGILGSLNVFNLLEIIEDNLFDWNTGFVLFLLEKSYVVMTIVFVLGIVLLLSFTFVDKIIKIKRKWVKIIISVIVVLTFLINISLMILGTHYKLSISLEDKLQYEFVTIDEKEYVVLSEHDNKILVVMYEIGEHGRYIFKTSKYWLYEKNYGTYRFMDIKYSPEINIEGKNIYE